MTDQVISKLNANGFKNIQVQHGFNDLINKHNKTSNHQTKTSNQ